jgi:hypothetical protein
MGEIMHLRTGSAFVLVAALVGPAAATAQTASENPTPEAVVKHAIDAAGGYEAFSRLGIVLADVTSEEVAQAGAQSKSEMKTYFKAPGPLPGRIEVPQARVISGDDGTAGWAVVGGEYDPRPSMKIMVRRLLRNNLFSLLLPFSLNWDEVTVTDVAPVMNGNVPAWRLSVSLTKTFFQTPQIATNWTVDIDRKTYAVVQARCPATDLGRGIKADGMLITWGKPQIVRGMVLPGEQRVVGLSETGAAKTHTRVDQIRYELLDSARNVALFSNPVPPELRPTPQVGPDAIRPQKP